MHQDDLKKIVRQGYGKIARSANPCGYQSNSSCCSGGTATTISHGIGYSDAEIKSVPEGANLGLGCGNPVALASLQPGEIVLDLGSGAGFDSFLAAQRVGPTGRIIGVDMTPEMIDRARTNARRGNYTNVEFRLGEIEHLPVADNAVDVIISNCVINLAPDKRSVFLEAIRVLKPGGRLMISDIVLRSELPAFIKTSVVAYIGCLAGALLKTDYLSKIQAAGFIEVTVLEDQGFPLEFMANDDTARAVQEIPELTMQTATELGQIVRSVKVAARKPRH